MPPLFSMGRGAMEHHPCPHVPSCTKNGLFRGDFLSYNGRHISSLMNASETLGKLKNSNVFFFSDFFVKTLIVLL